MRRKRNFWLEAAVTAALMSGAGGIVAAQAPQGNQGSQGQPGGKPADKSKTPDATPLTLDAAPPVNAEEDAAFKAFQDVLPSDSNKKIELGLAFVQKYPESRYKPPIYAALTYAYLQIGQVDKMKEFGEKELALAPNDVSTLALLGQTLPRTVRGNPSDAAQVFAKAEQYSKQAIEITATLPKPANLTDEAFATAKNQTLAMAHSGLGLVYVRRGKYAEAVTELEQATKIDPNPDPVNYYLLGVADKSTSHFDDAVAAFNKCASMPGSMQPTCKAQAEEAKKLAATQLSAPK